MDTMGKKILVLGGGTAGWMTATTLLSQFPDKKITLVESPNISNIGVGESTVAGGQSGFKWKTESANKTWIEDGKIVKDKKGKTIPKQ